MRPRGQTPRMPPFGDATEVLAAIASMRPRGQTPRMLSSSMKVTNRQAWLQ